jgi:hypothetical protein
MPMEILKKNKISPEVSSYVENTHEVKMPTSNDSQMVGGLHLS